MSINKLITHKTVKMNVLKICIKFLFVQLKNNVDN